MVSIVVVDEEIAAVLLDGLLVVDDAGGVVVGSVIGVVVDMVADVDDEIE